MHHARQLWFHVVLLVALILTACGSPSPTTGSNSTGATVAKPIVFAAFATPLNEPWDAVIHRALLAEQKAGTIDYTWKDDIGYDGAMEGVLRQAITETKPTIIFGDAFGNEDAVAKVAREFPAIAFVFGSSGGPAEPNLSVFDNWIHEPAYLSGLIAGSLTKSNKIGVVGGYAVPEVNRLVNGFIQGVKETNPKAEVMVAFIESWYDPAAAKKAAMDQIAKGADILYGERVGVIEAAQEKKLMAFGNLNDQHELAPDTVITSAVWHMEPTVQYVIKQVKSGTYTAQDLKDFSMMGKGGAALAPFYTWEGKLPPQVMDLVKKRTDEIKAGKFRVEIDESNPIKK